MRKLSHHTSQDKGWVPLLPPATKLGQGYIFTGVCHSVNRGGLLPGGGCLLWGGVCSQGGGGPAPKVGGWWRPPGMATAVGSTHPTGMHSCSPFFWPRSLFPLKHCSVQCDYTIMVYSNRACTGPGMGTGN